MTNPFFKNTGPYEINDLLKLTSIKNQSISNEKINDIKDLGSSKKGDITFLHSKNIHFFLFRPFYIPKIEGHVPNPLH